MRPRPSNGAKESMSRVKALFYGINGTGLGHISRLLNVAREARALLHGMGVGADFHFVTTSEAPQVAWDFPVYKLPSKTVVAGSDTPNREFAAHAQFFVTNLTASLRPDLLVMDTVPEGSFGEFLSMRAFCRRKVFLNRHQNEEHARTDVHQQHLLLYDLVLIPASPRDEHRYVIPAEARGRAVFTGPIHGYREEEGIPRQEARRLFGVQPAQSLIYVSAGGGGDQQAENELDRIVAAVRDDPRHFVTIGYGPLYRGKKHYDTNVVPLTEPDVRRYFRGIDWAISAAGYNTYQELLAANVPTAFYAQAKGWDCQSERIQRGFEQGWNLVLPSLDSISIQKAITALGKDRVRASIRAKLAEREPSHGALSSAVEILRLHESIKGSPVNVDRLYLLAQMRKAWTPLTSSARAGSSSTPITFTEAARLAIMWHATGYHHTEQRRLSEDALIAWRAQAPHTEATSLLEIGQSLAATGARLELSNRQLERLLERHVASRAHEKGSAIQPPTASELAAFCEQLSPGST